MRAVRRFAGAALVAALLLTLALLLYALVKNRPQDLPWTKLDLAQPIGLFTGHKLAGLTQDFAACRALLDKAGVRYSVLPQVSAEGGRCGYADGVRFAPGGPRSIRFAPAGLGVSCPVAAALAVWEWEVLQPAARRHFGSRVVRIDHLGSYSCRRLYGRSEGDWSEHATADAIDVAGFRLANGERVSVLADWDDPGAKGAFLREAHDGGRKLFATVLSPDYNAAHRDHLHMDQAERGARGLLFLGHQ